MQKKVVVTADRACDLNAELLKEYDIKLMPFYININERSYIGDEEIKPKDILHAFKNTGSLAKTAAMGINEYVNFFKTTIDQGIDMVHIAVGSKLSCAYQNCMAAKAEIGERLKVIDSKSISTGMGLIVLEAAQRAKEGLPASRIVSEVENLTQEVRASFIIDNLKFLSAGGRCSAIKAFGANLLSIKPSVLIKDGTMVIGEKYRGNWAKCVLQYARDTLNAYKDIKTPKAFITHSGTSKDVVESLEKYVKNTKIFKEVIVTKTESATSCHCGPNTIGLLFLAR